MVKSPKKKRLTGTLQNLARLIHGKTCMYLISRKGVLKGVISFLVVVLAAYRQMNAQAVPVLSDIDEDNFDRAFDFFRPST